MKNTTGLVLLSLSVGLTIVSGCNPQPESINVERVAEITSIAILPFGDAPGVPGRNSGAAVSGFVTGELAKHPRYRIIERSRLKSVLDEQDLQTADLVDPATAAKIGRMLGVHAVIVGSASEYDMDKTTVYVHVVPIVSRDYKVGATIRMIDVTNGRIVYAHSASGHSGNSFTEAGKQAAQKLLSPLPK